MFPSKFGTHGKCAWHNRASHHLHCNHCGGSWKIFLPVLASHYRYGAGSSGTEDRPARQLPSHSSPVCFQQQRCGDTDTAPPPTGGSQPGSDSPSALTGLTWTLSNSTCGRTTHNNKHSWWTCIHRKSPFTNARPFSRAQLHVVAFPVPLSWCVREQIPVQTRTCKFPIPPLRAPPSSTHPRRLAVPCVPPHAVDAHPPPPEGPQPEHRRIAGGQRAGWGGGQRLHAGTEHHGTHAGQVSPMPRATRGSGSMSGLWWRTLSVRPRRRLPSL